MKTIDVTGNKVELRKKLDDTRANCDRAIKTLELIDEAQHRINIEMVFAHRWSMVNDHKKTSHRIDILRRAIVRLSERLNHIAAEIQL